jgi:hypothetical protein
MRSIVALASTLLAAGALAACSSGDDDADPVVPTSSLDGGGVDSGSDSGSDGASSDPDSAAPPDPAAIAAGATLVMAQGCNTSACHTANLSGNVRQDSGDYSANLTPDPTTGIFGWTETDLTNALQEGVDSEGKPLCASMPRFSELTTTQIAAIYAYLESIPAVTKARTSTGCAQ